MPGWVLGFFLLITASCTSLEETPHFAREEASLYRTSMMDAASFRHLTVTPLQCSKRYMSILGGERRSSSKNGGGVRIRIEKNWPPDFDNARQYAVIPLSATVERKIDGAWVSHKVRGFAEFRNLSACRIERAAFVPSDDSSVLEPALWILTVSPGKKAYWTPRLVILTAYRTLVNETLSIVGPVPFRSATRLYFPNFLKNGVLQENDLLRGVTPPNFSGTLSSSIWLKNSMQRFIIDGEGNTGLFSLSSEHTRGIGIYLPYPAPFYRYPQNNYRFALSGSLFVDGPFAFEGEIVFDNEAGTALLRGRINQAGSVVPDFQIQVPYVKGDQSHFRIPGEVDFSFSFNHRTISLVLLPDSDRTTYWIGALDQNIFGLADPR